MPSLSDFVRAQFLVNIPKPTTSFASKTVIVTGANGGLGLEISKHILRLGAQKLILACRSRHRGEAAKKELEALFTCGTIEVWELDLESPESIKKFVDQANALPRIDALINNAGIQTPSFKVVYGTERTLAMNTIGTFLLALQLIPKLKETAQKYGVTPHCTIVSSALYDVAKYPEPHGDDLFTWFKDPANFNMMDQYNLSKLLQLYAEIKLATAVDPVDTTNANPIVINSLDPCFLKTGLASELTGVMGFFFKMFEWIAARPAEEGARLVVQAATAGRETHGKYLRCGAVQSFAAIAQDDAKATYVWELLCKKFDELQPGILGNLK